MMPMSETEANIFFGNYFEVNPEELFWCDSYLGLKSISESEHVAFARAVFSGDDYLKTAYVGPHRRPFDNVTEGNPSKFAELANSIKNHGYDSSRNPRVKVAIDGDGKIVLVDGLHRSSIMYCLGKRFVCEVVYRDHKWIRLKYLLYHINNEVKLYQPVNHSDLRRWPCWRIDTNNRIKIICDWLKRNMPDARNGLDMGCHTGRIVVGLANNGYTMTGIDVDNNALLAARTMADMEVIGTKGCVSFCEPSYFDAIARDRFDFIICLSLLNHYACDENRWQEGWNLFKKLCKVSNAVFYDCPSCGDPVGGDTEMINASAMTNWLKKSGICGDGEVIAEKNNALQRTIMVWKNRV